MADVSLKEIHKTFGRNEVIHGISCDIKDGEFVVVLGPSGCGKSTVLRLIAGLEALSSGEIRIDGMVVNNLEPAARDVAMVFQNYALYPHMTVYRNMAYGLKIRRMPKAEINARVNRAAQILGLAELLDRKPSQLSGGQRQRVAMGRCIVREPKVFLFDEPLSNLDAKLRVQMRLEIRKLHEDLKITSIYVTHDQVEAMTLGDRLIVMDNGYAAQIGSPLDVYQRPTNLFVAGFIGSPSMNFFDASVSPDGRRIELPAGVSLPLPAGQRVRENVREVILGFRPEHLRPAESEGAPLPLHVDHVELLGADTLVHGHLSDIKNTVTARIPWVQHFAKGTILPLTIAPESLHLFDPENRNRVGLVPA